MLRYEQVVRRLLFLCPPELAHSLARRALRTKQPWAALYGGRAAPNPRLRTRLGSLAVSNPVGLAAGLDKNAEMLRGLEQFGFGYIVVGGVLPRPNLGNRRPRVLRYPESESLINCYGLPSAGVDEVAGNLRAAGPLRQPVVVNIDAAATAEYLASLRRVQEFADAIEIQTGCPNNVSESGEFMVIDRFRELMDAVVSASSVPVFVKLTGSRDPRRHEVSLRLAEAGLEYGVEAFTLPGTWDQVEPSLSLGRGHVSGRVVLDHTISMVQDLYRIVGDKATIKAAGGISTAEDAFRAIEAGATTVDVLTSVVYRGPRVVDDINDGLAGLMENAGVASIGDLVGRGPRT